MCGPAVAWDWLVLDIAFIMLFAGGGLVLRASSASVFARMSFVALSFGVGGFLFWWTYRAQQALARMDEGATTLAALAC